MMGIKYILLLYNKVIPLLRENWVTQWEVQVVADVQILPLGYIA